MSNFSRRLSVLLSRSWLRVQKRSESECPGYCGVNMRDRGICVVDPCDAQKCYPSPRVVIIGAGMAGLSAAARLTQQGIYTFTVLEAYERPGGRIHSCYLGDIVAELGSHWRPDNYFNHPIHEIGATENPPRPGVPAAEHPKGLFSKPVAGSIAFPPTITAYYKFRQIEQEAAQLFCLGGNKQHGSMLNFMSLRIQQELHHFPEEHQHDIARIMFGLVHIMNAKCGDDTTMLSCDVDGCYMRMPGGEVQVPLGLMGVLAPILRQIPEGTVRYCKPVNCVYWGTCQKAGCRAIVYTCDGDEFPADYVIITVSLGVLYHNHTRMFCPALPAGKIDAMRCLGYGACDKIFVEYCRPFWYWHAGELNFDLCSSKALCDNYDWTRGITRIEVVPNSKHVLCAYVTGDYAVEMEWLRDIDVAQGITDVLKKLTGNKTIPYPKLILRSNWSLDPFFCGAYSYDFECSDGCAQAGLAVPVPGPSEPVPPILLFAGEATVPGHFATVGGARISGIREAERVCELTLRYKGPPLPPVDPIAECKESKEAQKQQQ